MIIWQEFVKFAVLFSFLIGLLNIDFVKLNQVGNTGWKQIIKIQQSIINVQYKK